MTQPTAKRRSKPLPVWHMSFTAQKVIGTRGRHWQIVNQHGGLITYFEGTKAQATREARRQERLRG